MKKKTERAVKVKLFVASHLKGKRSPHVDTSSPLSPTSESPSQPSSQPAPSQPSIPVPTDKRPAAKVTVFVSPQTRAPLRRPDLEPADEREDEDADDLDWDDEEWDEEPTVRLLVAPKVPFLERWFVSAFLVSGFWLAIAALLVGSGWVAIRLIVNPGSVGWLSWMMPEWNRKPLISDSTPRSLSSIRDSLAEEGLAVGNPITLQSDHVLLPVLAKTDSCDTAAAIAASCRQITELRVYQIHHKSAHDPILLLADRLAVRGTEEFFVVAPLASTPTESQGSSRLLPFTEINPIPGVAPHGAGNWLQLKGNWQRGSNRLVYGQVVYYDAKQARLSLLSAWTSPTGEVAGWQAVTGDAVPELVVNQTVGLEPAFQVYQVKSSASAMNPQRLDAVPLTALDLNNSTYKNGILLAQSGLWSPALQLLQTAKERSQGREKSWSATAQAQLDLVALHAHLSQQQASHAWSSPGQDITTKLIDGRWTEALKSLQAANRDGYDVTSLLRDESGRLWRRINAASQIYPNQADVQAWGMLVIAVQQNRGAAIAWLQQQLERSGNPPTQLTALDPRLQETLGLLNTLTADNAIREDGRWLGTVDRLASINPADWLRPGGNSSLQLASGESWYRVQITSFHDGQQWQRSPFSDLHLSVFDAANQLWNVLGLGSDPQVQIMVWSDDGTSQTLPATVKAARYSNGSLQLLITASDSTSETLTASPFPALAMTPTIQWLEPGTMTTLSTLYAEQPTWVDAMLPALWQEFRQTDYALPVSTAQPEDDLAVVGTWSVQLIDLTGNDQPEAILLFQPSSTDQTQMSFSHTLSPDSRTIIFSDQGNIIYSDIDAGSGQAIVAIADLGDNGTPALIIGGDDTYRLRRWSTQNQRFE